MPDTDRGGMSAKYARWEKFLLALIANNWSDVPSAYMEVYGGMDRQQASKNAYRLTRSQAFQEFAQKRIREMLSEKQSIIAPKVIEAWLVRAFYRVSDILNDDGTLKHSLEELDRMGLSPAIDQIEQRMTSRGHSYIVVKLANRDTALAKLAEYVKIVDAAPQVEVNVNQEAPHFVTVERLTEEEWRRIFSSSIGYGGPNEPNQSPSLPQPSSYSLAGLKEEENQTS